MSTANLIYDLSSEMMDLTRNWGGGQIIGTQLVIHKFYFYT